MQSRKAISPTLFMYQGMLVWYFDSKSEYASALLPALRFVELTWGNRALVQACEFPPSV